MRVARRGAIDEVGVEPLVDTFLQFFTACSLVAWSSSQHHQEFPETGLSTKAVEQVPELNVRRRALFR